MQYNNTVMQYNTTIQYNNTIQQYSNAMQYNNAINKLVTIYIYMFRIRSNVLHAN